MPREGFQRGLAPFGVKPARPLEPHLVHQMHPSLERQLKTFRMPAAITTAVSGDRYVTAQLAPEAGGWVFVDVEEQHGFPMQPPAALVTAASDAALASAAEASLAAQTAEASWSPATSVPTLLLAMLADLNLGGQAPPDPPSPVRSRMLPACLGPCEGIKGYPPRGYKGVASERV